MSHQLSQTKQLEDKQIASRPATSNRALGSQIKAYIALTKPRIIELLLITTVPTMFLAAGGFPHWLLILNTIIGGYLAAGGANALNMYLDRDIDAKMKRTKNRPLVTGEISSRNAVIFGLSLSAISAIYLWIFVNPVSASMAVAAIFLYVVFYTMILKRRTSQNIVWGGIAGCMPVLIGWSAVTGGVSATAFMLFLVIFFWTPPHYWPLAERFTSDYQRAGVPMLPVVSSRKNVAWQMIAHTIAMVICSLSIIHLAPTGIVYALSAIALGSWFTYLVIRYAYRVHQNVDAKEAKPMSVFHASITYLTLLFIALAIDPFISF